MYNINPRNAEPLPDSRLEAAAPAIFAFKPHREVSDRYTFVPTIDVVNGLRDNGWNPVFASQSNSRRESGQHYAKHQIRFRHGDMTELDEVGAVVPEIVLFNSHDAGSSFQLHAGLHRKVCANGLVLCDQTLAALKVVHTGEIVGNIIEGAFEVINEAPAMIEKVKEFQAVDTNRNERLLLANAASQLRWKEGEAPLEPFKLLAPRRYGDNEEDLWTVFNVLQENLVKGGQRAINANGNRIRSREVKAPQQNIGLNKALWTLAEGFIQLKNGQALAA